MKKLSKKKLIIGLVAALFLVICSCCSLASLGSSTFFDTDRIYGESTDRDVDITSNPTSTPELKDSFKVTRIIDGDTIEIDFYGDLEKVRLVGIDTPESTNTIECFGKEATAKMKELLSGKEIQVETDPTQAERDKYGRLLFFVFLEGKNINLEMIKLGFANEYTYEKPYKYQKEFKEAEDAAREGKLGLWGDVCTTPTPTQKLSNSTPVPTQRVATTVPTQPPSNPGPVACQYSCVTPPDINCSHFSTHNQAQAYFNCCGFTATNDPMKLDGSGNTVDDGIACESLP